MKKIKIFILAGILISFASCKKLVEIKETDLIATETFLQIPL